MSSEGVAKWFITISPKDWSEVDETSLTSLLKSYENHHAVIEYGKKGSHKHMHIYIEGSVPQRQDNVRRRWQKICPKGPHVLKVVPVHDRQKLIERYLDKERGGQLFSTTLQDEFTPKFIQVGEFEGEPLMDTVNIGEDVHKMLAEQQRLAKPPRMKHLTLANAADTIIRYAKQMDKPLETREDLSKIVCAMYASGLYRMPSVLHRMKWVYKEIQMISGQTLDVFDEY